MRTCYTALGVGLLALFCATEARAAESAACRSEALVAVLAEKGLLEFSVAEARASFPIINSRWFEEGKNGGSACWKANRNFGERLLVEGERLQSQLGSKAMPDLEPTLVSLAEIANWVASREGYGNLLIERRLREIVAVGIARLVVAPETDTGVAESLIPSVETVLGAPGARSRILNHEVGQQLLPESLSDAELRDVWQAMRAKSSLLRTKERGGVTLSPEHPLRGLLAKSGLNVDEPSDADTFFIDESCASGSVLDCWERKLHSEIAFGSGPVKAPLSSLLQFGETVGRFPDPELLRAMGTLEGIQEFKRMWAEAVGFGVRREVATEAWSAFMLTIPGRSNEAGVRASGAE